MLDARSRRRHVPLHCAEGLAAHGWRQWETEVGRVGSTPRDRFLASLSDPMRRQVLAIPDVLTSNSTPVGLGPDRGDRGGAAVGQEEEASRQAVIFTARKAVCVADSLRRLGIWTPRGAYTSTRALTDTGWVAGGSFLLVDDVASSGRTIRQKVRVLREAGAVEVKCFAMSIEGPREQWEESIDAPLVGPIVYSTKEESLLHARSLIAGFQSLPRPYNVDWPMFELEAPLATGQLREAGWRINRSGLGAGRPYNLEFTKSTLSRVLDLMPGWARGVASSLQFSKARVFPVTASQAGGTAEFLVPIAALGRHTVAEIDLTVSMFDDEFGTRLAEHLGSESSYRALQYLLSQLLGHVVLKDDGRSPQPAPDREGLTYLFNPIALSEVEKASALLSDWTSHHFERAVAVERSASVTTSVERFSDMMARDTERAFADGVLTACFMERYAASPEGLLRLELASESNIKRRREIVDELATLGSGDPSVLDASLEFSDLRQVLHRAMVAANWESRDSTRLLVSDFLDRSVDAGEVVPEERLRGDVMSRRFRAGEILDFQREVQALAEVVLRTYTERVGALSIASDTIQKLISGFFRYLISKNVFTDKRGALSSVDRSEDIQMRYHIRGVVLSSVDLDFVSDSEIQSFATLESVGVLSRSDDPDRPGYVLPAEAALEAPDNLGGDAEDFGEAMAHLLRMRDPDHPTRRLVAADDFARLVTLVNPTDQCLAPGADICIAINLMRIRHHGNGSSIARSEEFQAVNQGMAKVVWTLEDSGRKLLEKIDRSLVAGDIGPLSLRKWRGVLGALNPTAPDSQSTGLVRAEARWLADAHVFLTARRVVLSTFDGASEVARSGVANRAYSRIRQRGVRQMQSRSREIRTLETTLAALATDGLKSDLITDVRAELPGAWTHLESAAGEVLGDCYSLDLKSRGVSATKRSFRSFILVLSRSGWSDESRWEELSIAGVSRGMFRTGERPSGLAGLRAVIPLHHGYSCSTLSQVRSFCTGIDPDSELVLVEDVPRGLRVFLEGEEHAIVVPEGVVQLVERSQGAHRSSFVRVMHSGASTQILGDPLSAVPRGSFDVLALAWTVAEVFPTPAQTPLPGLDAGFPTINLTGNEVTVIAGDNFNFDRSQIGAVGSGSSSDGNVFAQRNDADLASELPRLLEALELRAAESPPLSGDALIVREAIEASSIGDDSGVLAKLARLSRGALETAREIGVEVAAAAIVKASGLE